MRGGNSVYSAKKRNISIIFIVIWLVISTIALAVPAYAEGFDHYDNTSITPVQSTSSSNTSSTTEPNITKEELDVKEFNGSFLDTFIYILGGVSGFMMILQLTAFIATKLYPSANRWVEKLSKIGIDGYSDGFVFPTIKILLLGVFAYLCISGYFKQIIVYIVSWFVTLM